MNVSSARHTIAIPLSWDAGVVKGAAGTVDAGATEGVGTEAGVDTLLLNAADVLGVAAAGGEAVAGGAAAGVAGFVGFGYKGTYINHCLIDSLLVVTLVTITTRKSFSFTPYSDSGLSSFKTLPAWMSFCCSTGKFCCVWIFAFTSATYWDHNSLCHRIKRFIKSTNGICKLCIQWKCNTL